MKNVLLFAVMLIAGFTQAQQRRICGSMDNLGRLMQEDPSLAARMQQIETQTAAYIQQHGGQNTMNMIVTVPVVFHIVYNTSAQNISTAQCMAQLNQLNLDYARQNTDRTNTPTVWQNISANTNIQFCLAQRDPSGAATTGIERKQSTVTSWSTNDNVKHVANGGLNAWPAGSYLNIWVCNLSNGILGYAQFPGGSSATDGVVLHYQSVGSMLSPGPSAGSPYNMGRTATHEVGHWMNLFHIWGDESACSGTDNVGDTPNQGPENYGCPSFPHTDNCQGSSPGVMFMNYMDYVDDNCMNMFTSGQSTRMNALFATGGTRASILNSPGCQAPSTACGTPSGLASSSVTGTGATLSWTSVAGAVSYNIQYKTSAAAAWTTTTSATNSKTLTGLLGGTVYQWQVQAVCSAGAGTYSAAASFTTLTSSTCGTPSGLMASSVTASSATLSWAAVAGATSYTIQYKVSTATAWNSTTSSTSSKSLIGLVSGVTYQWKVQAICSGGAGAYSSVATFMTLSNTTCGVPSNPLTSSITTSSAVLSWTAVAGAGSYKVQYKKTSAAAWTQLTTTTTSYTLSGLVSGTAYQWQVQSVCTSGPGAFTAILSFTTSSAGCTDIYEPNNTYTAASTISTNTTVSALISSTTDGDWYRITTASPYTKIKITLTNLAGDYDVRLYNSSIYSLAISQNGGTTSETIIYNATLGATYYIRVYGYNGAYSASQCYNLRVNTSSINYRISGESDEIAFEEIPGTMKLYPNPVHDNVNIVFNSASDDNGTIRIFDMVGKTVYLSPVNLTTGENKYSVELTGINPGIYFAELQNSTDRIVTKFIIDK